MKFNIYVKYDKYEGISESCNSTSPIIEDRWSSRVEKKNSDSELWDFLRP